MGYIGIDPIHGIQDRLQKNAPIVRSGCRVVRASNRGVRRTRRAHCISVGCPNTMDNILGGIRHRYIGQSG